MAMLSSWSGGWGAQGRQRCCMAKPEEGRRAARAAMDTSLRMQEMNTTHTQIAAPCAHLGLNCQLLHQLGQGGLNMRRRLHGSCTGHQSAAAEEAWHCERGRAAIVSGGKIEFSAISTGAQPAWRSAHALRCCVGCGHSSAESEAPPQLHTSPHLPVAQHPTMAECGQVLLLAHLLPANGRNPVLGGASQHLLQVQEGRVQVLFCCCLRAVRREPASPAGASARGKSAWWGCDPLYLTSLAGRNPRSTIQADEPGRPVCNSGATGTPTHPSPLTKHARLAMQTGHCPPQRRQMVSHMCTQHRRCHGLFLAPLRRQHAQRISAQAACTAHLCAGSMHSAPLNRQSQGSKYPAPPPRPAGMVARSASGRSAPRSGATARDPDGCRGEAGGEWMPMWVQGSSKKVGAARPKRRYSAGC